MLCFINFLLIFLPSDRSSQQIFIMSDIQVNQDREEEIQWVKEQFIFLNPKISHAELRLRIHQLIPLKKFESMLIYNPKVYCSGDVHQMEQ